MTFEVPQDFTGWPEITYMFGLDDGTVKEEVEFSLDL